MAQVRCHAPPPVVADPKVAALRDDALDSDHYAWDIVEGLTTEVGQRLAATEAEARARDWAVRQLTAMGFANVHVEPFAMPVWTRGAESAEIVSPFPQKLVVAALGNSGSTGPQGVTGEIVDFDSVDALRRARQRGQRQDRVHRPSHDAGPGRLGLWPVRRAAAAGPDDRLAKGRARRSSSARSAPTITATRTPASRYFTDGAKPIPAGALTVPDAEQLVRILKRGQPVTMHLTLVSQRAKAASRAMSSPKSRAAIPRPPILLVGGHLDSWDLGTGAIDDGAGVAITTAAAKRIMDAGRPLADHPHRLVRGRGDGPVRRRAMPRRTASEPHHAIAAKAISAPTASGRSTASSMKSKPEAEASSAALAPLGIVTGTIDEADGSDIGPMIKAARRDRAQPGRHPLFRLAPHARRHARQDRSRAAAAECRGVDGGACGAVGRHRAGAESAQAALSAPNNGRKIHAHRILACRCSLLAGACKVSKDEQRHDHGRIQSATSPKTRSPMSPTPPRMSPRDIGNDVKTTGDKIENKVGDTDVDVDTVDTPTSN